MDSLAAFPAHYLIHETCVAGQETFSVDPSVPDERDVHARSPTPTCGEPVLSSTGRLAARIDETNKDTQSFTIHNPRYARNVPTWNPSSGAEEVHA